MKIKVIIACLLCCPVLSFSHNFESNEPPKPSKGIVVELQVNFGSDMGQNFGTLFEARDRKTGHLLFGAGFPANYNSRFQNDRYQMEFFIRPPKNKNQYKLTPFSRPSNMFAQSYLYTADNNLHLAYFNHDDWFFDKKLNKWVDEKINQRQGSSISTILRGKHLVFQDNRLLYEEKIILDLNSSKTAENQYTFSYYANGHIFLSRTSKNESSLIAIPWTAYPDSLDPDINDSIILNTEKRFSIVYSYGQLNNEVLACTNTGGIYSFNGKKWKTIRNPNGKSYQIYSMITYNNRLLMGQYPTGFLLEYDGKNVIEHRNWPPVQKNASPKARELQTTAIYRGELFAGVWPWAELWRFDPDSNSWVAMGRLFNSPEVTKYPIHPYEEEVIASGSTARNLLGQRLTSMIPFEDSLIMGTSWKTGEYPIDEYTFSFLTKNQREEYGAIHRLRMPGNLTGLLTWKDEPIQLKFIVRGNEMSIWQDHKKIASATVDPQIIKDIHEYDLFLGSGVFGKSCGDIET